MDLFQKVERGTSFKIFSSIKRELISDFVIEFRFQDTPWTCSFSDFDTTNCAAMSSSQILIKTRNFKTTVNIRDAHFNMTSGKNGHFRLRKTPSSATFFFNALTRGGGLRVKDFCPANGIFCTANETFLFFYRAAGAENFSRFFVGKILGGQRVKRALKKNVEFTGV